MSDQLTLPEVKDIKSELRLIPSESEQAELIKDKELEGLAEEKVAALLDFDQTNSDAMEERKNSVETMGLKTQKESAKQYSMLKEPIKKLSARSEDGGEVANALINLRMEVEELDPAKFDFSSGWFTRMLGSIPGVGSPMKKYFMKYESAQTTIDSILQSLKLGEEQLKRDNLMLAEDQKQMRSNTQRLEKVIALARLIDQKLMYKLEREIPADDPKHKFVQEELLFPLRQRTSDLQQQLAVNQQGIIAVELIIRNNKELIRGVNRALNVTVSALEIAVTIALALANQKIVLDKINAINKTTEELIAGTAARLKIQGVEIQKQAASAQISIDVLKQAFSDINDAMNDISNYRREALPVMAQNIDAMENLTNEATKSIERMDEGRKDNAQIEIDLT